MTRLLMILRHAKSSWDSDAPTDFERPLGSRGERDAPRMGEWMKAHGLKPDYVVSSPAVRAAQTTSAVCDVLGVKDKRVRWVRRVYGSDVPTLLDVLSEVPQDAKRVMLVGHNPGLDDLLVYLWGKEAVIRPDGKLLTTAALAQVELSDEWNELEAGGALKVSVTRPKDIA